MKYVERVRDYNAKISHDIKKLTLPVEHARRAKQGMIRMFTIVGHVTDNRNTQRP